MPVGRERAQAYSLAAPLLHFLCPVVSFPALPYPTLLPAPQHSLASRAKVLYGWRGARGLAEGGRRVGKPTVLRPPTHSLLPPLYPFLGSFNFPPPRPLPPPSTRPPLRGLVMPPPLLPIARKVRSLLSLILRALPSFPGMPAFGTSWRRRPEHVQYTYAGRWPPQTCSFPAKLCGQAERAREEEGLSFFPDRRRGNGRHLRVGISVMASLRFNPSFSFPLRLGGGLLLPPPVRIPERGYDGALRIVESFIDAGITICFCQSRNGHSPPSMPKRGREGRKEERKRERERWHAFFQCKRRSNGVLGALCAARSPAHLLGNLSRER